MTVQHEYETTFIVRPEALDDEVNRLRARFESIITDRGGQLMVFEDWGRRRLAYAIDKSDHGRYVYLNYVGTPDAPSEIERIVSIEDNVVRFLTVRLEEFAEYDASFAGAVERQKKRINRGRRSDDSGDARRRRSASHDNIKSPMPIRYQNADGTGEDMTPNVEEVEAEAPAVSEAAAVSEPAAEAAPAAEAEPAAEAAPAASEEVEAPAAADPAPED
jgi:small subunit ribosomal protein S6